MHVPAIRVLHVDAPQFNMVPVYHLLLSLSHFIMRQDPLYSELFSGKIEFNHSTHTTYTYVCTYACTYAEYSTYSYHVHTGYSLCDFLSHLFFLLFLCCVLFQCHIYHYIHVATLGAYIVCIYCLTVAFWTNLLLISFMKLFWLMTLAMIVSDERKDIMYLCHNSLLWHAHLVYLGVIIRN